MALPNEKAGAVAGGVPAAPTVRPGRAAAAVSPSLHSPVPADCVEVALRILLLRVGLDL